MNMMTLTNVAAKVTEVVEKAMIGTEQPSMTSVWAVVLIGLAVVFAALVILIAFVWVMGKFFSSKNDKKKISVNSTNQQPLKTAPSKKTTVVNTAVNNDDEIIAVISAAIAAMGQADGKVYKLKSVRAVNNTSGQRPVWAMAGLQNNTAPF